MKSLSLFVSAAALLSASSAFAIDCGTLPTCDSLGYNDVVAHCPKSSTGEDLAVKCPFDTTKGKCIYEAAVGQIGYFTKAPDTNSGWLLCDGKSYSSASYPRLAKLIETQFGGTPGSTFNVPDYRGFFLRVYANTKSDSVRSDFTTYSGDVNNSLTAPQKEGLPNIRGSITSTKTKDNENHEVHQFLGDYPEVPNNGLFKLTGIGTKQGGESKGSAVWGVSGLDLNASRANSIYGRPNSYGTDTVSHVVPGNMAVYAYIYAGKVVK